MTKDQILAEVVRWLHNDLATAETAGFWARAMDAISGDVFGVDSTVAGWDTASAALYGSLWFYACLYAGRVWAEDAEGAAAAMGAYQSEVSRVGTSMNKRGTAQQLTRPGYGA